MADEATVREKAVTPVGLRIHYREWEILRHRSWDTVARSMAGRFGALDLDHRGNGESARAADYHEQRLVGDLVACVDELGLETFSIGGFAAGTYAALHPDRIERLALAENFTEETELRPASHIQAMRSLSMEFQGSAEAVAAQTAAALRSLAPCAPKDELRRWMLDGLALRPGLSRPRLAGAPEPDCGRLPGAPRAGAVPDATGGGDGVVRRGERRAVGAPQS